MTIVNYITEASLSRVWQHVNGEQPFTLLTAFRSEYDYNTNVQRNKTLAANIKNAGFGYFYVDGYWVENQNTENEVRVKEDSIFAIGELNKDKIFFDFIIKQINSWDQEAALIRTKDITAIYDKQGNNIFTINNFVAGVMGDVYSKLRHHNEYSTFVFENERTGKGFIENIIK